MNIRCEWVEGCKEEALFFLGEVGVERMNKPLFFCGDHARDYIEGVEREHERTK